MCHEGGEIYQVTFGFLVCLLAPHAGLIDEVLGYFDTEGKEFMLFLQQGSIRASPMVLST
jgi:hypothetical protein